SPRCGQRRSSRSSRRSGDAAPVVAVAGKAFEACGTYRLRRVSGELAAEALEGKSGRAGGTAFQRGALHEGLAGTQLGQQAGEQTARVQAAIDDDGVSRTDQLERQVDHT